MAWFITFRVIFVAFQWDSFQKLNLREQALTFGYGLRIDLSAMAYLLVIPMLVLIFSESFFLKFINIYTRIWHLIISTLAVSDTLLYKHWGFRIDASILTYLSSPSEVMASASWQEVIVLVLGLTIFILLSSWVVSHQMRIRTDSKTQTSNRFLYVFLVCTLILPMRGGWQLSPINQSSVAFSDKTFANHAALNVAWNFFDSVSRNGHQTTNPYHFFEPNEAQKLVNEIVVNNGNKSIKNPAIANPNVLIIIWESLTAKVVGTLEAKESATPNFDTIAEEGLLFKRAYASGNRSDKGLVAILSGYPAQARNSILGMANKAARLPVLAQDFAKKGYQTGFYYGGDIEFFNMKNYLLSGGFQHIISRNNFDSKDWNSKWGTHDGIVYQKLLNDLNSLGTKSFFYTLFTLSSHEPYDTPTKQSSDFENETEAFMNSHRYADECFKRFIDEAQKQPWWPHTLVVVVGDHGHRLPESNPNGLIDNYQIPLLFLGGGLNPELKGKKISTVVSQTDIAQTLYPSERYNWSINLSRKMAGNESFAYFAHHEGFGIVKEKCSFVFDAYNNRVLEQNNKPSSKDIAQGKAYLQMSFEDFLKK
jgi:phosphoglycerol transferase MdoB-like AlkP superfamily enzyme